MRIMPRALCRVSELKKDYGWIEHESVYLVCEDSPQCVPGLWRLSTTCFFSFALHLVLFLLSWILLYIDFLGFTFSMSPTIGCIQHSTAQNTYVVEDQPRCPLRPPLSRSALFFPALDLHRQCTWRMSFWVCTWVQTVSAVQIDIPDCDRHIRTYTFAGLRSLQVQALSHIDPLNSASNYFKAAVYKGESKTKKHKFMINIH